MGQSKKPQSIINQTSGLSFPIDSAQISIISQKDLVDFDTWLKDNASVTQYSKLTPTSVLTELLGWKMRQIATTKKQLSDSTTNKKK